MSLFSFPFFRKSYSSLGNPVFISDILASNQLTIDGLSALTNLGNPGFAIIAGMEYNADPPGTYAPGIFWLNGAFYSAGFTAQENSYLAPLLTDTLPKIFQPDLTQRPTYTLYQAQQVSDPTGATPQLSGNMNVYRIGLWNMKTDLLAVQNVVNNLRGAAFADIGVNPGNVVSATDTRLVGDLSFFDGRFAKLVNVILKGTIPGTYVPVNPGDPVNKAYSDATSGRRLASGTTPPIGDISGGPVNVSLGVTLADNNYIVLFSLNSLGNHTNDSTYHTPTVFNKTTTQFTMQFQEGVGVVQNVSVDWIVFAK